MPCQPCLKTKPRQRVSINQTSCGCSANVVPPSPSCSVTLPEVIQPIPCLVESTLPLCFQVDGEFVLEALLFNESTAVVFAQNNITVASPSLTEQSYFVVCSEANNGCWAIQPDGTAMGAKPDSSCSSIAFGSIPESYLSLTIPTPASQVCGTIAGDLLTTDSPYDMSGFLIEVGSVKYRVEDSVRLPDNRVQLRLDTAPPTPSPACQCYKLFPASLNIPGEVVGCVTNFFLPASMPCGQYQATLRLLASNDSYPVLLSVI